MIEPSSQRLVQPWEASNVDRWLPARPRWRKASPTAAIGGILGVLIIAMVAQALEAESAAMAVTAAAWGFLTFTHLGQGSAAPRWSCLLPLLPLAILLGAAAVVGAFQLAPYELIKKLGAVSGLAAFAAGAHLCMQRESVCRRVLLTSMIFGTLFVGMSCATRVFSLATPDLASSLSLPSILGVLSSQSDLIAISLICLSIGLAMILESINDECLPPGLVVIALVPLAVPLAATRYGAMIAGALFALAVGVIIARAPASGFTRTHNVAILIGVILASLCCAHGSLMSSPSAALAESSPGNLWSALQSQSLWGDLSGSPPLETSNVVQMLSEYGYAGAGLIGLSFCLYAMSGFRSSESLTLLGWWCWIGVAVVIGVSAWQRPLDHPVVSLLGIILLTAACTGNFQNRERQRESSESKALLEEDPPPAASHDRLKSSDPETRRSRSSTPSTLRPIGSAKLESLGKPLAPLDPPVRIARRRQS